MKITKLEIEKLASLSKIEAQDNEAETLREKLQAVLSYASGLAKITKKSSITLDNVINVVRKDEIISCDPARILKEVPEVSNHFIVVPKIVK